MRGTETVGVLGGLVVELVDVRGVAAGGVVVGHLQGAVAEKLICLQCGESLGGRRVRKFDRVALEDVPCAGAELTGEEMQCAFSRE